MARTKNPTDEAVKTAEELQNETAAANEESQEQPTVAAKPEAKVVAAAPKTVKIRATEDSSSWIGGSVYTFKKDKEYAVPSDVAAILTHGRKAYRM